MNKEFWSLDTSCEDSIACVTEAKESISYKQLHYDVDSFGRLLPEYRALVFLFVDNRYASIVAYLACLKFGHPFLLLDVELEESVVSPLMAIYKPNLTIVDGEVTSHHSAQYEFDDSLAMLMSTSGTTGAPKLVRLSRDNLTSNAESIVQYLEIERTDVAITTLPMSYSYGVSVINSHLAARATFILNTESIISRDFWSSVETYGVTSFSGVPFTFQMLKKLNYKRFKTDSIRYLTQAGGKLDEGSLDYFDSTCRSLGQKFYVMYGQTEASPRISYLPPDELSRKIGSIGIPIPNGRLEILSDEHYVNEPYKEGELIYFGRNVMMGYASTTDELALPDTQKQELRTGDIGYFDADGYFFVTGRAKRFIKLFGLRISLDAIDNWLAKIGIEAVATGSDDRLVICFSDQGLDINKIKMQIAKEFKLNINFISYQKLESIPRKNGGKVDFKLLNKLVES